MWLIHTTTLRIELVDLYHAYPVRYAILSHTWEDGEVSFQDLQNLDSASSKKGFKKIEMTCMLARQRGLNYAWIDTCCIDKTNNVELTEAINSMFRWYAESEVCFVYLPDLQPWRLIQPQQLQAHLGQCRWFTRGWTLQELIAPKHVEILDREWSFLGQKISLAGEISAITGIDKSVLLDSGVLKNIAVARKMSWASSRKTTRIEDMAYCLIGIFDINMPMIYGEGRKAFHRLQEEIAKETNDLSLFAWTSQCPLDDQEYRGVFADSPREFADCGQIRLMHSMDRFDQEFAITNKGLRIEAILTIDCDAFVLNLQCFDTNIQISDSVEWLGIYLTQTPQASVIGLSDIDSQPFQVVAAKPEKLWDPSKGLYLIGDGGRFTGFLHLECKTEDCPPFEFIIVCGRRHLHMEYHPHIIGSGSCRYEHWCAVFVESDKEWASILDGTNVAGQVADVSALDHLYQSFGSRPLLTHDHCELYLPLANFRATISICLRSGALGDLKDTLAVFSGEAQCIDVKISVGT